MTRRLSLVRHRLFLTLFLLTLTLGLVAAANIAKPANAVTNTSHKIANTGDHYVYESSYQNPGFYAQGLFWVFYEDSSLPCEGQGGCLLYTTSADGVHFATPTNVGKHVTDSDWSTATNGTFVFYARYNETSFQSTPNQALLFGAGKLSGSGTVAWYPEQVVRQPNPSLEFPSEAIGVDTNGQVWIGYQQDNVTSTLQTPHIIHSVSLVSPPLATSFVVRPVDPTAGQSIQFNATASGGTSGYTFSWNFGDGSTGNGQNITHTYVVPLNYTVTLTTDDSSTPKETSTSTQTFPVGSLIPSKDSPPNLLVPPSLGTKTGSAVSFKVTASDSDGDSVALSRGPLPSGATFDPSSGQFSWTPTLAQTNQIWTLSFTATDNNTLAVMKQVLVYVSPLWATDFALASSGGNWHVDVAILVNGQIYAGYWAEGGSLFGRLYDGTNWGTEEQVSSPGTSTDVNSFVFAPGSSVTAIYYDSNTESLYFSSRGPSGGWGPNLIGRGEAASAKSLPGSNPDGSPRPGGRYSLPFTAAFDQADSRFYVFWYNDTTNLIDEWSGASGSWTHTPAAFSTRSSVPESTIGSFHYSSSIGGTNAFGILWIDGTGPSSYNLNFGLETIGSTGSPTTDASWNPNVRCPASIVNIETILGNQNNSLGGATESGSIFNPGIQPPQGVSNAEAKRWLTANPVTLGATLPPGWHSPGPPCSIQNADGQTVSAFVEIDGVQRGFFTNGMKGEDNSTTFDASNGGGAYPNSVGIQNDTTFNIFTPGHANCGTISADCMHTIHIEFDHDWKAAGYCGRNTVCDPYQLMLSSSAINTLIDVQGFIFWDPDHLTEAAHAYSGWELHPLTAWRLSNAPGDISLSATPNPVTILPGKSAISNITINSYNDFSGSIPLSATVSPAGPTLTIPPTVNVQPCNNCGITFVTLNITTSSSNSGKYNITVVGGSGVGARHIFVIAMVLGFTISANPATLTIPAGSSANSTIIVTSLGNFNGPVSLTASLSGCPCGLSTNFFPNTVNLSAGGTATAILKVTSGSGTGNATIIVTGTSGLVSSSTKIPITIVDFSVATNPSSETVLANRFANSTITVAALNGFTGTVALTKTVPSGLTCTLSTTSIPLTSTASSGTSTLQCNGTAGNYIVTVTANSTGLAHSTTFAINIQDYAISAAPTASMVDVGAPGTSTIRVNAINGFTGTISFNQNGGAPCGLSAPSVVLTSTTTSASVVLTCTYQSAVTNIVQVASTSGPLAHSATVTFQIVDFTISASPTSQTVDAGAAGTSTITLTALNGYNRTLTLTVSPVTGITCLVSPAKITLQPTAVTSILSCSSTTAADYTLTVTGTNGTLSHPTIGILFHVIDFELTTNIPTLTLGVGQNSQAAVAHVASLNGFTGTLSITIVITPSGPSASPIFSSLKIPLGGNQTSLNINAGQIAGLYTLNITATRGSLSHWTLITLRVNPITPTLSTNLSSSNPPLGTGITDQATLSGATSTASGTVSYFLFTNGACTAPGALLSSATVSNDVVPPSRSIVFNSTGTYSFNATYSGDSNNSPAKSSCEPLNVQKDNPTITTSLSPSVIQVGQSTIDSATLTNFFQASGMVNYNLFIGSSTCSGTSSAVSTVTVANGIVPNSRSVTFNSTNSGYSFQAIYSGDGNNNGVPSGCESITVNPVSTAIATTLSTNPIIVGGSVFDTSTLSGQTSIAGGTVTYNEFPNSICSPAGGRIVSLVIVNNGVIPNSRSVMFNSTGTFSFDAVYSGDPNNKGSTSACETLIVNKTTPTITTTISPQATITVGSPASDQATLTTGFPSSGVTGSVTYSFLSFSTLPSALSPCSSGTLVGTPQTVLVGVSNSVPASSTVTPISAGFYGFSAVYNGDGNNTAVPSNCEPLTVNKQTPAVSTTINPSQAIVLGASASDHATITGGFPSTGVGGTVTYNFFGLGNGICSGAPTSSQVVNVGSADSVPASNSQTPGSVGQYSFNATYSGDANNNAVTSSCEPLMVNPILTTTGVSCGSSITVGVPTTCNIIVTDVTPGTLTPTGTVNLSSNSTGTFNPPPPCTLSGSGNSATCTVTYTPLVLGTHNVTATYSGDSKHARSSGSTLLIPGKHSTSVSLSCTSPVQVGQDTTCIASVKDTSSAGATTPTGSVSFTQAGVAGTFNVTSCTLVGTGSTLSCGVRFTPSTSGTADITGSYGGDSTHAGSNNSAAVTVNPLLIVSVPTAAPLAVDSAQSSTLTATFTGGNSPYTCQWLDEAPGANVFTNLGTSSPCTSPVTTSTGTLSTPGSWSFELLITDSSNPPVAVTSGPVTVSVNNPVVAPTISANPTGLDLGQSSTLSTSTPFSGGTSPYSCQWLLKGPGATSYSNLGASVSCNPGVTLTTSTGALATAGVWSFGLKVSDSGSPSEVVTSNTASIIVNSALAPPVISASPTTVDVGQTTTLSTTTSFSGGSAPYTCQWLAKSPSASTYNKLASPFACNAGDTPATSSGPISALGTWSFELQVNDTGSPLEMVASTAVTVSVNGPRSAAAVTPGAPVIDSGQSITLTAHPSGGTSPYTFQWYSDASCTTAISAATFATFIATPSTRSNYTYRVTDSASSSQCSPADTILVNQSLAAGSIAPSTPSIDTGQSITLTANPSGGTPVYIYKWFSGSNPSCSSDITQIGTSASETVSPGTSTYYCYTITDSSQGNPAASSSSATDLVTVNSVLTAGSISPASPFIDASQLILLTAHASGGTPSLSYQWYSDGSCTTPITSATSSTYQATPSSAAAYSYSVTDSANPPVKQCSPPDTVTVNPALVANPVTPSAPTIDSGQSVILTANPTGGTTPYAYQWFSGSNPTCSSDTTTLGSASTQIVSPTTSTYYCYKISDSSLGTPVATATSQTDLVTINPQLAANTPTASPSAIDTGQSSTISATFTGGTSPYTCQWLVDAPGSNSFSKLGIPSTCTSPTSTSSGTLTTVGTWSFELQVNDSGSPPESVVSNVVTVAVNGALQAGVINPNAPTIDNGQTVVLTAAAAGGIAPYSYQWYSAPGCVVGGLISGATLATYSATPTAATTYSYKVTDSASSPVSQCSQADTVTVDPVLTAGVITPSAPKIDNGQTITLTDSPSGGTPPYSIQWYSGASPTCSLDTTPLGTSSTQSVLPPSSTYYCYSVTDSAFTRSSQSSMTDLVTVNQPLVAGAITPVNPTIDTGQSVNLTANPSGGSAPYTYQWYSGTSSTCSSDTAPLGTTAMQTVSSTVSAYYCYRVTDSSNAGQTSTTSGTGQVVVNPALTAPSLTALSPIDSGQSTTITVSWSGGSSPYTVTLYTSTSATSCAGLVQVGQQANTGTATTLTQSPTSTTSYCVSIIDSAYSPATSQTTSPDTVKVNPALVVTAPTAVPTTIDSGQSSSLSATFTGGTPPLTCQWLKEAPGANAYSNLGTPSPCTSPSTISTGILTTAGTWSFKLQVTDSSSTAALATSSVTTVVVNPALTAPSISAAPTTIDAGQSSTLSTTASFRGGTATYTCQWLELGPQDSTYGNLGSSFSCSPGDKPTTSTNPLLTAGTWSFELQVADGASQPQIVTSAAVSVSVSGPLSAGSVTPASPAVDSSQSITLTSHAAGGQSPYLYQWYSDGVCSNAIVSAISVSYTASPTVTTTYSYKVTDSTLASQCSPSDTVTVNPVLVAGAAIPSAPVIDVGQSVTLSASVLGGTTPYFYQWFSAANCPSAGKVSGATSSSFSASPPSTTTYSFSLSDSSQGTPTASTCSPADSVTVNPQLVAGAVTPPNPIIDSGQSITLTSHASGGAGSLSYQWYSDASCTTPISGAILPTYNAAPTATVIYSYKVSDSANSPASACSPTDSVTVKPALTPGTISPRTPFIDAGQSITLTASPSGGTTPYSIQWYSGSSQTCASDTTPLGTSATQAVSPSTTTYYCYTATDSAFTPASQMSATNLLSVNPSLSAGAITPSSSTINAGQTIVLNANPTGGTTPYHYQWYSATSAACPSSGGQLGTASSQSALPVATTYYCYVVTDNSEGTPTISRTSASVQVTVDSPLTAGAVTPSNPTIDSGQSITLTAAASGGTTPYSYQWFTGSSPTCSSDTTLMGTGLSQSVSPTSSSYFCYNVTDGSAGSPTASAESSTDLVTVNPPLIAGAIAPSSPSIDSGQSITLTSAGSGGTQAYSYQWFSDGTCNTQISSATTSTYTSSPSSSTTYSYRITDKATLPSSVCSSSDIVTVHPNLIAQAVTPSNPKIDQGQSITLTANPSGGTGPYSYQWFEGSSATCASDTTPLNPALSQSVSPSTNTYYCYKLTDSAYSPNSQLSPTDQVIVDSPLNAGAITPSAPTIDSGQSITLSSNTSGGTAPYAYQWFSGTSPICATDTNTLGTAVNQLVSPISLTYYCYTVMDSSQGTPSSISTSSTSFVAVDPALTVPSLTAVSPIDSGQSSTITVSWSGGRSPYTVTLYTSSSTTSCSGLAQVAQNIGIAGTSTSFMQSPTIATSYCTFVTDSAYQPATQQTILPTAITVNPDLSVNTPSTTQSKIDAGQSSSLSSTFVGGTSPLTCQWLQEAPGATSFSALGGSSNCSSPVSISTGALTVVGTWSFEIQVTDSSSFSEVVTSQAISLTVSPSLSAPTISASPTSIDSGQSASLSTTVSFSGGTSSYTCQWLKKGPLDSSYANLASSFSCIPSDKPTIPTGPLSTSGAWSFELQITDSGSPHEVVTSAAATVAVIGPLSAGTITPSSPAIDTGQSISLSANAAGGQTPYIYQWYSDSSCTTAIPSATSQTYTATPSAATTYSYKVTDSASSPVSQCSPADTVTVNLVLAARTITPSGPAIDSGQSITLTASPTGGTAPYAIQWYSGSSQTCASDISPLGPSATQTVSPSTNTYYCYTVTDSAFTHNSQTSTADLVSVNPTLSSGAVTPSSPTIDQGQSITLSSHASGGTPSLSYQWYSGSSPTCSSDTLLLGTASTQSVSPNVSTYYCYQVTDSAYSLSTQRSQGDLVTVNSALSALTVSTTSPIDSGQSTTVTVTWSGGTSPYSVTIDTSTSSTSCSGLVQVGLNPALTGTMTTFTESPAMTTNYCAVVTDSATPAATIQSASPSSVSVYEPLTVNTPTASPLSLDTSQSSTLYATFVGGAPTYKCQWLDSPPGTTSFSELGSSSSCISPTIISTGILSTLGSWSFKLQVTDSSSTVSNSSLVTVTVNPVLTGPTLSATRTTITVGQSTALSTSSPFNGGTATYTCQWLMRGPLDSGYSSLGISFFCNTNDKPTESTGTLSTVGSWSFVLQITDSGSPPNSVLSNSITLIVEKASPTIASSLSASNIAVGSSVTESATITGGYQVGGTVTYRLFGTSDCTGIGATIGSPVTIANGVASAAAPKTLNSAGKFGWNAAYSGDPDNNAVTSGCQTLTVLPILSVPSSPITIVAGNKISFVVNATDPSESVTLTTGSLPSGASFGTVQPYADHTVSSVFSWTPPSDLTPGEYNVTFTATVNGVSTSTHVSIRVIAPAKSAPLPLLSYSIFGVVGFLAVLAATILLRRIQNPRRKPAPVELSRP